MQTDAQVFADDVARAADRNTLADTKDEFLLRGIAIIARQLEHQNTILKNLVGAILMKKQGGDTNAQEE